MMKSVAGAILFAMCIFLFAEETLIDWSKREIASIRVVDFRQPMPTTPLRSRADGVKFRKASGDVSALELEITPGNDLRTPGIWIRPTPQERYWNLSEYQELHVELENLNLKQQAAMRVRITNPGYCGGTYQVGIDAGICLNPGEKSVLKLYYPHADEFAPCKMFAVGATPPGIASIRTIDARKVDGIIFSVDNPKYYTVDGSLKLRIGNVRLVTPRKPLPPELSDPTRFYPFIDRYGQYKYQDWPEKIHSAASFAANQAKENRLMKPKSISWNQYGGWANGPTLRKTGFFRAEKYQGKWFLVDPEGKLFFSFGINSITMGEYDNTGSGHPDLWFETKRGKRGRWNFTVDNLTARYGKDYAKRYPAIVERRMFSWGVNTIGNWSSPEITRECKVPYVINITGIRGKFPRTVPLAYRDPQSHLATNFSGIWDVFDPGFEKQLRQHAKSKALAHAKDDAFCIGVMIDNEINWGHNTYQGDRTAIARSVMLSDATLAAKKEFVRLLREKYLFIEDLNKSWGTYYRSWDAVLNAKYIPKSDRIQNDLLRFNRHFINHYYKTCRAVAKEFSPHMLYMGSRINLLHQDVLEIASKYCDVMTINCYTYCLEGLRRPGLSTDIPVIITEFQVGVIDRGMFCAQPRQCGVTQDDRARAYRRIMDGVLRHPQIVGMHWFAYRDQPATGRRKGPWQENYAVGIIDKSDTPYWEMTEAMRLVGEKGVPYRVQMPAEYDILQFQAPGK